MFNNWRILEMPWVNHKIDFWHPVFAVWKKPYSTCVYLAVVHGVCCHCHKPIEIQRDGAYVVIEDGCGSMLVEFDKFAQCFPEHPLCPPKAPKAA